MGFDDNDKGEFAEAMEIASHEIRGLMTERNALNAERLRLIDESDDRGKRLLLVLAERDALQAENALLLAVVDAAEAVHVRATHDGDYCALCKAIDAYNASKGDDDERND